MSRNGEGELRRRKHLFIPRLDGLEDHRGGGFIVNEGIILGTVDEGEGSCAFLVAGYKLALMFSRRRGSEHIHPPLLTHVDGGLSICKGR